MNFNFDCVGCLEIFTAEKGTHPEQGHPIDKRPVLGSCPHASYCMDCFDRILAIHNQRRWFPCPICKIEHAVDRENVAPNLWLCHIISTRTTEATTMKKNPNNGIDSVGEGRGEVGHPETIDLGTTNGTATTSNTTSEGPSDGRSDTVNSSSDTKQRVTLNHRTDTKSNLPSLTYPRPIEDINPRQAPVDFTNLSQSSWYDEDNKQSQHRKRPHSSGDETVKKRKSNKSSRGKTTEVVEIDSEDDRDEYSASDGEEAFGGWLTQNNSGSTRRSLKHQSMEETLFDMDVARIAIGKKVSTSGCHVAFSAAGKWMIEYDDAKSSDRVTHQISSVHIKELRYYKSDTDVPLGKIPANFISMKINANKSNGLAVLSNSYSQNKGVECKYVVIDFLSAEHLEFLLSDLRAVHVEKGCRFSGMRDESKTQLTREEVPIFAKSLMDASEKESRDG